jgi:hypothetical protein
MGLLPHRAANADTDRMGCGLSPAVISKVEATSGPTPLMAVSLGAISPVMRCSRLVTTASC